MYGAITNLVYGTEFRKARNSYAGCSSHRKKLFISVRELETNSLIVRCYKKISCIV